VETFVDLNPPEGESCLLKNAFRTLSAQGMGTECLSHVGHARRSRSVLDFINTSGNQDLNKKEMYDAKIPKFYL